MTEQKIFQQWCKYLINRINKHNTYFNKETIFTGIKWNSIENLLAQLKNKDWRSANITTSVKDKAVERLEILKQGDRKQRVTAEFSEK